MINRSIASAVITGPTGAIGIALCNELAKHDILVYAVCRPHSSRAGALPSHRNIIQVECDVSKLEKLQALIPHADVFFHFAWAHTIGPGRNDMSAQIQNIQYTIDAVQAAKALGCQLFIGAGSQAEYGRVEGILKPDTPCFPENGYGMAKLCAGQMSRAECQKAGLHHIWVRILSVYGPGDSPNTMISSVIRQLLCGERPSLTEGIQQWDYLYSGDAALAFRLLAQHGADGSVYPLGGGKAWPLRQYVELLRDAISPDLPLNFGAIPYQPLQVMHLQADISQLTADTGFKPRVSFQEGIRLTIDSLQRTNSYD